MSKPLRFVSWAAVSSLPQTKRISLEDQLSTNREHITRHGGQLVAELVVPGESRSIVLFEDAARRIEAYARLKEMIDAKAFDVLIYLDRSRLGRKASLSMAVVELCHEAGIATYETENPPALFQPNGAISHDEMLIGAIKSVGAQREIQKLQERRKSGMVGRVERGEFACSVPWGWQEYYDRAGNCQIEIDAEAAEIIRLALLDLYLEANMPIRQIVEEMNKRGYRTQRGRPWTRSAVRNLLNLANRYAGWAEYNIQSKEPEVRVEGKWPAIITKEQAERIQQERKSRSSGPYNWRRLFSRTSYCETCGTTMVVAATHDARRPDQEYVTYQCRFRCHGSWIPAQRLYAALHETIAYLSNEANHAALLRDMPDRTAAIRERIAAVQTRLAKIQQQRERANRAYIELERLTAEEYDAQMAAVQKRQEEEQAELKRLHKELDDAEYERNLEARLKEIAAAGLEKLVGPPGEANAWIRRNFRIYVANNRVTRIDY